MLIYFLLSYFLWILVKWINLVQIIPALSASAGPATHTVPYKELNVHHNLYLRLPGHANHKPHPVSNQAGVQKACRTGYCRSSESTNCLSLHKFCTTIFQHISEGFGGFSEERDCVMFFTLMTGSISVQLVVCCQNIALNCF